MKGFVTTCDGKVYELPALFSWEFSYTGGEPCDSFTVRCPYEAAMAEILRRANRFSAEENGAAEFCGVIDECLASCDDKGKLLELSGRGMAALLLDNEAEAVTYQRATAAEILKNHVLPYGIRCGACESVSGTAPYRVASGCSQWKALSDFTRYYGGFLPYFGKDGVLTLVKKPSFVRLCIDESTPVTALQYRDRRYGVISEALVVDKTTRARQSVFNGALRARGGLCRRVFYVPARSGYQAMRYTGEYQIERSKENAETLRLTIAAAFAAQPGSPVTVSGSALGVTGDFCVTEVVCRAGESGRETEVTMQRE